MGKKVHLLWMVISHQLVGMKLAALGSIKDAILHIEDIALGTLNYLKFRYPEALTGRFKLDEGDTETLEGHEILEKIARRRGLLLAGGEADLDRAARLVLKELRRGNAEEGEEGVAWRE